MLTSRLCHTPAALSILEKVNSARIDLSQGINYIVCGYTKE